MDWYSRQRIFLSQNINHFRARYRSEFSRSLPPKAKGPLQLRGRGERRGGGGLPGGRGGEGQEVGVLVPQRVPVPHPPARRIQPSRDPQWRWCQPEPLPDPGTQPSTVPIPAHRKPVPPPNSSSKSRHGPRPQFPPNPNSVVPLPSTPIGAPEGPQPSFRPDRRSGSEAIRRPQPLPRPFLRPPSGPVGSLSVVFGPHAGASQEGEGGGCPPFLVPLKERPSGHPAHATKGLSGVGPGGFSVSNKVLPGLSTTSPDPK